MRRVMRLLLVSALFSLLAACGGGGGDGSSTPNGGSPPPATQNTKPQINILAAGQVQYKEGSDSQLGGSVGSELSLSGSASTDAERDVLTFQWTVVSKPQGSVLLLPSDATAVITFKPDSQGTYTFNLRVTDARGAYADKVVSLVVDNSAPNPAVLITATYSATPTTKPPQEISIGANIMLDASTSTDIDGDPVTTTWSLLEKPTASLASLTISGNNARFSADAPGIYRVLAHASDPLGAYSETIYVLDAQNRAPNAVLLTSVNPTGGSAGQSSIEASLGYNVLFDSAGSTDPEGQITRAWSITQRPANSTAQLSVSSGISTQFVPDALGTYAVRLTVTDDKGASTYYTSTVIVNNTRPMANIATSAAPISLPSAPSVRIPINTQVRLRGDSSYDTDNDSLSYAWTLVSRPVGSGATIGSSSSVNATITPDITGTYVVRLRVTDTRGDYSDRTVNIETGNYAAVAVLDKSRVTVLVGSTVRASAALSYDEDGDALSYSWSLDARPAGSSASIPTPNGAELSFTPDVPGLYVAAVSVRDGYTSSIGYVNVRVLSAATSGVSLPFLPIKTRYSKGLDKLIVVATNPDTLRIVDPFIGSIQSVALPSAVKEFQLSPNGKLAAVLHEGRVSLVNLETATLGNTYFTGGAQTDVFVQNDGYAYLIGQTGGQWVDEAVVVMNLYTGVRTVAAPFWGGGAYFYGTQKGVFADRKNKVLFMAYGLSPADISYFNIDPATHTVPQTGDSRYHGDWPLGDTFWLSGNQDLVFTSAGTFFQTETLDYVGSLGSGYVISLSHSSQAEEALTVGTANSGYSTTVYKPFYTRYYGSLLLKDADITLPTVAGEQSYALAVFHSANDNPVLLVQTMTDVAQGTGAKYYVITR
jgi:hypothetical protein